MKTIPAAIFDRIEYSFGVLKNNFKQIFLPLFLFHLVAKLGLGSVVMVLALQYIDVLALIDAPTDVFLNLWTDPKFIIIIVISMVLFLGYVLLIIPFVIATIQAIKNAYHGVNASLKDNIVYGFKTFVPILGVYWHIFAYVALIPALLFIVWGLIMIVWLSQDLQVFTRLWILLSGIAWFLFIIFSAYRWLKAAFSLYQAVENNSFDKKSFMQSVAHSDGKWWRVFGNMFLMWIILAVIASTIGFFINTAFLLWAGGFSDIVTSADQLQTGTEELNGLVQDMLTLSWLDILQSFLLLIVNVAQTVCMMVFVYIFYKRLALEDTQVTPHEKQTIEL